MRWAGNIGFMETDPTARGVHRESLVTRKYKGEMMRNAGSSYYNVVGQMNPDVKVNVRISVLMDPFINYHFSTIRWAEWMGCRWTVVNKEVFYPRVYLTLGDVYVETTNPEDDDYG